MRVHPVRAQPELLRGMRDAGVQTRLSVRVTELRVFRDEATKTEVDVSCIIPTGKTFVEDHHNTAMYDERHSSAEGIEEQF